MLCNFKIPSCCLRYWVDTSYKYELWIFVSRSGDFESGSSESGDICSPPDEHVCQLLPVNHSENLKLLYIKRTKTLRLSLSQKELVSNIYLYHVSFTSISYKCYRADTNCKTIGMKDNSLVVAFSVCLLNFHTKKISHQILFVENKTADIPTRPWC